MLDGSGPPNAKDPGTSTTPPITEDALVPHGPIPLPSDNNDADSPSTGNAALKKEVKDDGESLLDGAAGGPGGVVKANKGMILRKSVEYIRYLQQLVTAQGARNRELEGELRKYRGESPLSSTTESSSANGSTSAANPNNPMMSSELGEDSAMGGSGGLTLVDDLDDLDDPLDGGDPGPFGMGAFSMNVGVDGMRMMGIEGDAAPASTSGDPDAAPKDSSSSATPTANAGKSTKKKSSNGGGPGLERRKSQQHQRHSSSSGRLPSMPEEQELEDEETTTDDGSPTAQQASAHPEPTGLPSHFGQQQQQDQQQHHGMDVDVESTTSKMNGNGSGDMEGGERGRTGARGVRANGGPGAETTFGGIHHQMQQQQQQMGYQMGQAQVQMGGW
ncbi:hypothetical protein H1R20_g286, partial [Candolleomyces eurysporus]